MGSATGGTKAARIKTARIRDQFYTPVLAPVMQSRGIIILLGAVAALPVVLAAMGLPAWQCPLKATLGVACPGCGLTRAIVLLAEGQWQASIDSHAFAPIGLGIGMLLATGGLLPTGLRHKAAGRLAAFERRTGMAAWLIVSALIYWFYRLMLHI